MARTSLKAAAKQAQREDAKLRKALTADAKQAGSPSLGAVTLDSFQNFQHKLGVGGDNPLSGATYGFNPISRNRTLLEWIHRGSWLGGLAVDVVADDMTRAGIEYTSELAPDAAERIDRRTTSLAIWHAVNEVIKWGRLYGGCLGVALIDGQDLRTPLRLETVGPGQFKGILPLDRWMVEPELGDLVTEFGPSLGLPKYYRVTAAAPALRGAGIHYSRVLIRHVGVMLPYQQRLMENLWGMSVLERLYDRMIAFDSASTGAAQLVYKSYLRTLSVTGMRDIISAGGAQMNGLVAYVDMMRRFQGIEGITCIDKEDTFETQQHGAFSGLSDALVQFGQQLSGALQIPLVRLFGQSPAGLNSTGESDLRMYYDHINQLQNQNLFEGVSLLYKLTARSEGVELPPNFAIQFKPLWQLKADEKANISKTSYDSIAGAFNDGIIGRQTALKELRQTSRTTGIFTNITSDLIALADDEVQQPPDPSAMVDPATGQPLMPPAPGDDPNGAMNGNEATGPEGQAGAVDQGTRRRVRLQLPA